MDDQNPDNQKANGKAGNSVKEKIKLIEGKRGSTTDKKIRLNKVDVTKKQESNREADAPKSMPASKKSVSFGDSDDRYSTKKDNKNLKIREDNDHNSSNRIMEDEKENDEDIEEEKNMLELLRQDEDYELNLIKEVLRDSKVKQLIYDPVTLDWLQTDSEKESALNRQALNPRGNLLDRPLKRHDTFKPKLGGKNSKQHEPTTGDVIQALVKKVNASNLGKALIKEKEDKNKIRKKLGEALKNHLRNYLYTATYLAIRFEIDVVSHHLVEIVQKQGKDMEKFDAEHMMKDEAFMLLLYAEILDNCEYYIFELMTEDMNDFYFLISNKFFKVFFSSNKLDFLFYWYFKLDKYIKKHKPDKSLVMMLDEKLDLQKKQSSELISKKTAEEPIHNKSYLGNRIYIPPSDVVQENLLDAKSRHNSADSNEEEEGKTSQTENIEYILTEKKLRLLIKIFFQCSDENSLLVDILHSMSLTKRGMLYLLLETGEEERLIKIANENSNIIDNLHENQVLIRKQYKLLILFDSMHLINIFNIKLEDFQGQFKPLKSKSSIGSIISPHFKNINAEADSDENKGSVFKELCRLIESGTDVEALCNVITYVNETFWDLPKAQKFLSAVYTLLYNSKEGANWVVYIQNPLQFFMTLVNFLKDLKEQLDFKDKKIAALTSDMMNFCLKYISIVSDQVLKFNLFEKDAKELCFLDYAFMVGDMTILEKEQIEGTVNLLWDQDRHTLQTLDDFMRSTLR